MSGLAHNELQKGRQSPSLQLVGVGKQSLSDDDELESPKEEASAPHSACIRRPSSMSRKSPVSPSLRPKGPVNHRILIPNALGEAEGYVQWRDYDLLVKHVVSQSQTISVLQVQIQNVCDLLAHQNRQLALAMRRPNFETEMPPPVPIMDDLPVPCPKPPRRVQLRIMTPLEKSTLGRDIYSKMIDARKRDGFRKIVHPSDWWKPDDLPFDIDDLDDEVLWKLWHFTRRDQSLQSVLTQDELQACKVSGRVSLRAEEASSVLFQEEEQRVSSNAPLDAAAAQEGTSRAVLALNTLKRSHNEISANSRSHAARGGDIADEDKQAESTSDRVAMHNDAAAVEDDSWLHSESDSD